MGVIFLDQDDEITTAISRLRASEDIKVALVLPPGSRLGTSRINFRLLAREAQDLPRQASIVTTEAGVRAIAVSAGLPAYASVDEYEAAIAAAAGAAGGVVGDSPAVGPTVTAAAVTVAAIEASPTPAAASDPAKPTDDEAAGGLATAAVVGTAAIVATKRSRSRKAKDPSAAAAPAEAPETPPDAVEAEAATVVMAAAGTEVIPEATKSIEPTGTTESAPDMELAPTEAGEHVTTADADAGAAAVAFGAEVAAVPAPPRGLGPRSSAALPVAAGPVRSTGVLGGRGWLLGLVTVVAVIGVLVVALAVVVLPQATITVAAPIETVGPVSRTVTADPSAIEPDPAAGVIPAELVTIPLTAEGDFTATGTKVTETAARGSVTFSNLDPTKMTTIPSGSVVSTDGNVRFRTSSSVRVPKAKFKGLTIDPGRASVRVEAVKPGPNGNVAANAIQNVPSGYDPILLRVTNPSETTGGRRTEEPRVSQEDVDKAMVELNRELEGQLASAVADPATTPDGMTIIDETAEIGQVRARPTPTNLVGRNVPAFSLALSANGQVIAVDTGVLEPLAADALASAVPKGAVVFPESIDTTVGTPTVDGGVVSFEIGATGQAWRPLDEAALLAQVRGRSVLEAEDALASYGEVTIDVWPFYVASIPDNDRVTLTVVPPTPSGP